MTCSVEGCHHSIQALGLCSAHYRRHRLWGDPLRGGALRTSRGALLEWIADHVADDLDECLIWPFSVDRTGYGQIKYAGKRTAPHRVMCIEAHGPAPSPRHEAAHECGRGDQGCVNPKHLRWSTKSENEIDKRTHGTDSAGERNPSAKLTAAQAKEIFALKGTLPQRSIAKRFGVDKATVANIHNRKSWVGETS